VIGTGRGTGECELYIIYHAESIGCGTWFGAAKPDNCFIRGGGGGGGGGGSRMVGGWVVSWPFFGGAVVTSVISFYCHHSTGLSPSYVVYY
jgi:hypothetical protein